MNDDLNDAELDALAEIARNDPARLTVTPEQRRKLVDLGYAEERHYAVIATGKGRLKLKAAGRAES